MGIETNLLKNILCPSWTGFEPGSLFLLCNSCLMHIMVNDAYKPIVSSSEDLTIYFMVALSERCSVSVKTRRGWSESEENQLCPRFPLFLFLLLFFFFFAFTLPFLFFSFLSYFICCNAWHSKGKIKLKRNKVIKKRRNRHC